MEKWNPFVMEARVKLVISALTFALLGLGPEASGQTIVFENVNVIPMDRERVLEKQTVVVRDGRIAQIGPAGSATAPSGATRVDGSGKFPDAGTRENARPPDRELSAGRPESRCPVPLSPPRRHDGSCHARASGSRDDPWCDPPRRLLRPKLFLGGPALKRQETPPHPRMAPGSGGNKKGRAHIW